MVDLPLEELENYQGTNPVPEDFWAFWEKQKDRMEKNPITYQINECEIPNSSMIHYYDLWFDGMNGGKIYAKYIVPEITNKSKKLPVILQFHGYPGASRGWFEQTSFASMGYAVLAMDCPGQGGFSVDKGERIGSTAADHIIMGLDGPPERMYYVDTFLDTCLLVRIAQKLDNIDTNRIYVNGASQGAGLGLVCTALNATVIKKCAALYPFLSDYKRAWDMDRDSIVYNGLKYYTRWFDPEGKRSDEIFTKLGYIDVQNFVERITCPVLFGTGLMDICCPPSTQFAVYHKIKAPKKHMVFPQYGHEEIGEFDDLLIHYFAEEEELCLD